MVLASGVSPRVYYGTLATASDEMNSENGPSIERVLLHLQKSDFIVCCNIHIAPNVTLDQLINLAGLDRIGNFWKAMDLVSQAH